MAELTDRMVGELVDAVRQVLRRESQERLRDVYLVGDIEKDTARSCIERLRELANDGTRPITLYINSAGGNVTDGLAIHDSVRHIVSRGIEVTIVVQGMAYSMGSIVLQAASEGRRLAFPHSWIMIHEPAKWAGWQSTSAAAQHLERLKQMQDQIYKTAVVALRQAAPPDHPGHQAHRFLSRRATGARVRIDRRRAGGRTARAEAGRDGDQGCGGDGDHAAVAAGRGGEGDAGA